jgi:hypothetical protein
MQVRRVIIAALLALGLGVGAAAATGGGHALAASPGTHYVG